MDNHLFSNKKFLPFWYLKISILSTELISYNNFFNEVDFKMYKVLNPEFGFYSLRKPSEIFLIHKDLEFYDNLLIAEFDVKAINIYIKRNNEFNLVKQIKIFYDINNLEFINLIKNVLQNDSRIILSEKMITGLIRYLDSGELNTLSLRSIYSNINSEKVLRKYTKLKNYNYLKQTLDDLIKINFDRNLVNKIPKISNSLLPDDLKLNKFIEGYVKTDKKLITYHTLLLSILIGRFGKETEINKTPMLIETILDAYTHNLNSDLRDDLNLMIRLFEAEKLIINDERKRYFVHSNYEAELFQFFTKHNFWWNIKRNASNFITLNNDIKKISISIFNFFNKLKKTIKSINKYVLESKTRKKQKEIVPICCYSGCDNTFINQNGYLLFIRTLSWLYNSNLDKTATNKFRNVKNFYKDLSKDINGIKINLIYDETDNHLIKFNETREFKLSSIYSYLSIIENYKNYDDFNINFNTYDLRFSFNEHMKIDLSQYILFALDCKINKYVVWTDDIYMKLICFLYGNDMIFENIFDGNRILELYRNKKEYYSL